MRKIGILTGGADCPGLNSVIRAVVRKGLQEGYVVVGVKNGWQGLVENDMRVLDIRQTSGILDKGGTILGTSRFDERAAQGVKGVITEHYRRSGMDALVVVGGEQTLKVALEFHRQGQLKIVGVPKSIDNALFGTEYAFGFDTAVNIATECIDRLHTTAESHHRIMVIEVMGQYTGWIALEAGIAGGADVILVPEFPVNVARICSEIKARHGRGKSFSIIVVAEGVRVEDPELRDRAAAEMGREAGKIGEFLGEVIRERTGYDTRVSVLGHIQRGGTPTAYDRIIGTQFGIKAVDLVREGLFGHMVSLRGNKLHSVEIERVVKKRKSIDRDFYDMARAFFSA